MAKISRRDFLKLSLAAAGLFSVWLLQKQAQPVSVESEPEPTITNTPVQSPVTFSQWGQENLFFTELSIPYDKLR